MLKYVKTYIIVITICLLSLILISFIPKKLLTVNVKKSAEILCFEGERKKIYTLGKTKITDNSTDAIMLNIIYSIDNKNIFDSIMKCRRNFLPNLNQEVKEDLIGDLPFEGNDFSMTNELKNMLDGKNQTVYEYARYWHGYIVILRFMLILFDIIKIRIIIEGILILLLILLSYFVYKRTNIKIALSILLAFTLMDLFAWYTTIQGMFVMIIAVIVSILVATKKVNDKNLNLCLFITGAFTVYFDFLTTPLITFLLPIIVYNLVNDNNYSAIKTCIEFVKSICMWGIGYIATWATKWIIVDCVCHTKILELSIKQIIFRIGAIKYTVPNNILFLSIFNNIYYSLNIFNIIIIILCWAFDIYKLEVEGRSFLNCKNKIVYYLTILVTLGWYIVIKEHSAHHFFFTYKTMLIPILDLMLIVLDKRNINEIGEKDVKH